MKRYYKVFIGVKIGKLQQTLNEWGNAGWRLIHIHCDDASALGRYVVIMERIEECVRHNN